ncbi:MAG: 50S ribosomal protein L4 [Planctomycetes bacterium]|jgi:large subunit ribosomal protein L4|nr:50S ribosomal protein L4 [Planctomycetota bacterium]
MTEITIYNAEGAATGTLELDPLLLDKAVRRGLLKEALIAHLASLRQGTHKTKKRGEVAGGGKKPWKQKGTGRARQGSTRSPQWVGGGHAKNVTPRDYSVQLPAQQRRIALLSSVRYRLEKGGVLAVEGLDSMAAPSTKKVAGFIAKIGLTGKSAIMVSEGNQTNLHLSARNLDRLVVSERRNLNAGSVLRHSRLIFTKASLDALVTELKAAKQNKASA